MPGPLLILLAATSFGTIGTARVLGPEAPAGQVGAVRLALAAVLLVAAAAVGSRSAGAWRAAVRLRPVWVAGAAQAAFQVTFLGAVVRTGVAVGTLVAIGSAPLVAALLAGQVSRRWAVATALAVAGLLLLVLAGGHGGARLDPVGLALALGAGTSYATYTVATSRAVLAGGPPRVVTAVSFSLAAAVLLPLLAVGDHAWLATGSGWLMAGYLAVVPTALAYLLFARGLESTPVATASTLALAEPVVATVLGVVVLDERLAPAGWAGVLLVLAGLVVAATTRRTSGRMGECLPPTAPVSPASSAGPTPASRP